MESLGKYLKGERESRNLSLKDVFESTKIKEHLLTAIEEDQYELLSSPIYVKGVLEAYARCLGLEPNDIVLQYEKYHANKIFPKEAELEQRIMTPSNLRNWLFSSCRAGAQND